MSLFNQSLWLDEATTALAAKMSIGDIISKFLPGDFHPPLYYFLMHYWVVVFGGSEIALRIPSYLFALATIYIVYKLAGKVPSILLATSGLFIYYTSEARMYMMITFVVAWAVYSFIKKKWLVFSILLVAIGMTDYVSLFVLPVFWILLKTNREKLAVTHLPLVISYLVWLPILIKQIKYGLGVAGSSWGQILGGTTIKNMLLIPVKFMIGRISFDDKTLYAILVFLLAMLFGYLLFKARKNSKLFWLWLIVPVAVGIVVSLKIPTLSYFRFLFVLPAFYILIDKGVENTGKYKTVFLSLVVGVNLITSGYYLLNTKFQREDWRSAAKAIGSDKIVFPAATQKEALIYYGKGNQIINSSQLTSKDREIWLSRYVWEVFDPGDSARKNVEALGYNKASEYNFNGVVFWKYEK